MCVLELGTKSVARQDMPYHLSIMYLIVVTALESAVSNPAALGGNKMYDLFGVTGEKLMLNLCCLFGLCHSKRPGGEGGGGEKGGHVLWG